MPAVTERQQLALYLQKATLLLMQWGHSLATVGLRHSNSSRSRSSNVVIGPFDSVLEDRHTKKCRHISLREHVQAVATVQKAGGFIVTPLESNMNLAAGVITPLLRLSAGCTVLG